MSNLPARDPADVQSSSPRWWLLLDFCALVLILPSVVSGTARWWWIGDLCCHFRLPYAFGLGVLAIAYAALRRRRWLASVSVVLIVNVGLLWPLFRPQVEPVNVGKPLRLLSANVFVLNRQPQPVLDVIRQQQPDLVLLMEVDERWMEDLQELKDAYPYQFQLTRDEKFFGLGPFGIVLFSRLPLLDARSHRLGTAQTPIITARIAHEGHQWTIIGVHPYSPITSWCAEARDSVLEEVAAIAGQAIGPRVVFGDINTTRWSPHFSDLLRTGGLRDTEIGFGYQPTWPDWLPWPVIPIDHLLASPDVAVLDRRVGPSIASDHRPLIVDVALRTSDPESSASSP